MTSIPRIAAVTTVLRKLPTTTVAVAGSVSGSVPKAQEAAQSGDLKDSFNPGLIQKINRSAEKSVSAQAQHRRNTWRQIPWDFPTRKDG
jgi:hypothetical protein